MSSPTVITPPVVRRQATPPADDVPLPQRMLYFLNPLDGRFEDLWKGDWRLNVARDFAAGLIVAMVAIPLAMGFAMASGLRPEQGIVGGAVAGFVGAMWGGSKYQVYGPTAAFIPVIGAMMVKYDHGMLVLASVLSGVILLLLGVARLGRIVARVPHSIIVGFTIGIATTIALSQIGEVLGIRQSLGYSFFDKVQGVVAHAGDINAAAIALGLGTFLITKYLLKITPYLPAPLIAIGATTAVAATVWRDAGLTLVRDKYGSIPTDIWVVTMPAAIPVSVEVLADVLYFTLAFVFVSAVESLLCSRMADRLADNRGLPYNPNKELWGQGMVQIIVPLLNGFPHTGALARTATNIKVGAVSPLAGVFKCFLKLTLAVYLATWLEIVPMACIGGILLYVATAMVKAGEVREVLEHTRFHVVLMAYTAVMVVVTDFLTGVLSAIVIWGVLSRFFDRRHPAPAPVGVVH